MCELGAARLPVDHTELHLVRSNGMPLLNSVGADIRESGVMPNASVPPVATCDEVHDAIQGSGRTDAEQPRFELPAPESADEGETSEDDEFPLERNVEMRNAKLRHRSSNPNESSGSSLSRSQPSPVLGKNPKKRVSKFYRKQSDLMENFKKDNEVIVEHQRRRQKAQSLSSEKDLELGKLLGNETAEGTVEDGLMENGKQDKPPKVTVLKRKSNDNSTKKEEGMNKAARWLAMATLIVNVSLVVAKAAASFLSGSLSIISSLVDSAVDITSGLVIWLTARAIKKRDPYMYPRGRTRLEPIALIIVSVIMGVASIQMIVQSLESIIANTVDPHVDVIPLCIMVATVLTKFTLMILCRRFDKDASISVLAQDHRNDCISNVVALFCAWMGSQYWKYLDPIGAVIVSVYIAITWYLTGKEHLAMLSGKSAQPDFINRIVKVCVEHDKRIDFIDTVYVYHFGTRYLVEVHIVLDKNMTLKTAHDISEALQINIEALDEVERAFVHCDYEYDHMPADEHKVV